jgi:hypothetical protein
MRIHWLSKSIPELAGLSFRERLQVIFACAHKVFRHWEIWVFSPLITGLVVCAVFLFSYENVWAAVMASALGFLLAFPFTALVQARMGPYYREYIDKHMRQGKYPVDEV